MNIGKTFISWHVFSPETTRKNWSGLSQVMITCRQITSIIWRGAGTMGILFATGVNPPPKSAYVPAHITIIELNFPSDKCAKAPVNSHLIFETKTSGRSLKLHNTNFISSPCHPRNSFVRLLFCKFENKSCPGGAGVWMRCYGLLGIHCTVWLLLPKFVLKSGLLRSEKVMDFMFLYKAWRGHENLGKNNVSHGKVMRISKWWKSQNRCGN